MNSYMRPRDKPPVGPWVLSVAFMLCAQKAGGAPAPDNQTPIIRDPDIIKVHFSAKATC